MRMSERKSVVVVDSKRPTVDEETNALAVEVTKYALEGLMS